jgi:formylglycine-generating enzyme required for sulfatase activity
MRCAPKHHAVSLWRRTKDLHLRELCRQQVRLQREDRGECAEKPSPEGTALAGSYQPNAWGLHDMIGNAFEFTEDCASRTIKALRPTVALARGGGQCESYATRSYFFDSMGRLRSAARCSAVGPTIAAMASDRVAVSLDDLAWGRKK